ncbi:4-hydroxybenzoate polyprenyltransferase, mitochondrial [Pectinophora gossypiella]|uniref:4-hydroxybenzoate polyprenyltransferase, mitochondrial n=1 Tax=Pectinophora gossypiella TaxID=13191 RepID=UPI00214EFA7C|nr:4-hydroxybenzoate polyprenyltransferase, mitochondrial [Pectinophora gossypiella]
MILYTSLKRCTITSAINLWTLQQIRRLVARQIHNYPRIQSCICGHVYSNNKYQRYSAFVESLRIHSTSSDQHRQKVVIETSTPEVLAREVDKVTEKLKEQLTLRERIEPYAQLARWDKPIGVYLLYWPCAWSIALASIPATVPPEASAQMAALFLAGAVLMRGAGCTVNDLWDRDVDAQVERTKSRPLVSGAVTTQQAVAFLGAQLTLALGVLLQLNCYSVLLGASSMLLVITYPLAKRFTNYPQIFLGATFNWGALLGYSAIQGTIDPSICIPLYLGSLAWTVIYDTIYAHQDKVDDARVGIKSTALTFGEHTRPALYAALAASAALLAQAGAAAGLAAPYYAALATYVAHAGNQIFTLNTECADDCAKKFKSNSMVGLIIFLGILGGGYSKYLDNREKNKGNEDRNVTKSCLFG